MKNRLAFFFSCIFLIGLVAYGQETDSIDFNQKYKYPFGISVSYQSYFPIGRTVYLSGGDYNFNDFSVIARMPIPKLPQIQPMAQVGLVMVKATLPADEKRNNTQFYGTLGTYYSHKFSKMLELGADLGVGLTYAYFPNLDPSGEARNAWMFNAQAGVSLGLNLSYNFVLDINPRIRYTGTFTDYSNAGDLNTMLNGFSLTLGASLSYRFGEDPDSPKAEIKSIRFSDVKINPLFASMQSYYVNHPIGSITIVNTEKTAIDNVSVSFMQSGYMDNPTVAATIPSLEGGEKKTINLFATFNDQIFMTEGVKPLTGEVTVTYQEKGRDAEQNTTVSYDLHDKEAITWDDNNKVGAFITPKDSALRNYTSYLRQINRDLVNPGLSENLQVAMEVFYGLSEIGMLYQRDPTSPFDAAQGDSSIIDAVSLPRNTLKRATGDCDDLTVLFCSLLETAGIQTAFITVPGHIYAAFDSKVAARDYKEIHPSKEMTLNIDGELWIPVEITMIGQTGFMKAWRTGVEEFARFKDQPDVRGFYKTSDAQKIYRPVALRETDLGLQYGDRTKVNRDFQTELQSLVSLIIEDYTREANSNGNKGSFNKLGLICARFGDYSKAESAFNTALSLDRNYLPPKINLGNVFFMRGEFQNALRIMHSAEADYISRGRTTSQTYAKLLLNISRSYYELENYDKAAEYTRKMAQIDPQMGDQYAYLAGSDGARGAEAGSGPEVIFVEEE